jgi:uncharacterized membrane protein YhaH (DUF805 family)
LIAGVAILFGFFSPLSLLLAMPVAFCVWWWDAPLSEWSTSSLIAGTRVLGGHVLLCFAYVASFRAMFALRATAGGTALPAGLKSLVPAARVVFGAWMLLNGLNHFFLSAWPTPAGATALSQQLMTALVHSQMLDVCMLIELVAGALILAGYLVPAALCTVMAVSTSALFWAVLDHQPMTLGLAVLAFGLNGLLLLAYLPHFKGALERAPLTLGESNAHTSYNALFVQSKGRTARNDFVAALIPLALATLWYLNKGPKADYASWGVLTLLYPAVVLQVRRLHDMGRSGWWTAVPAVLATLAMLLWANRVSLGAQLDSVLPTAALVATLGFVLWGSLGKSQPASA